MDQYVIGILLAAVFIQTLLKFSLLPRWVAWLVFPLAALLPFGFESRIGAMRLTELTDRLRSLETLQSYCALVVIQELLTLVVGLSLLAEYELGRRPRRWKFAVLLPSVLLPGGIFYCQAMLFNSLLDYDFREITLLLAGGIAVGGIAAAEGCRYFYPTRDDRIRAELNFELLLIGFAVLLPLTVTGQLTARIPAGNEVSQTDLLTLAALLAAAVTVTLLIHLWKKYKEKKSNGLRHANS